MNLQWICIVPMTTNDTVLHFNLCKLDVQKCCWKTKEEKGTKAKVEAKKAAAAKPAKLKAKVYSWWCMK